MSRPGNPDRREIRPDHLLRAVLDDKLVGEVLTHLGTPPTTLRATLEHRWLDTVDDVDSEALFALGIDLPTVLEVINPPFDAEPDWRGRHLSDPARAVLVSTLVERTNTDSQRVHAGHLLLGLLHSRDPLVAGTFRQHGIRLRAARPLVAAWGRRVW
jgi:Clp amino terminal domain, pathogenicity island component